MTSFRSTAAFYSRYRVPYPDDLLTRLKADANLGRDSLVLDLATGPGRLALALAPSVHEVIAVDVEPEMLDEGTSIAERLGVKNVEWVHARAEELSIEPNSIDLVTVGEAFHRLDQDLILRHIRHWLKDDACVALVGCFGILHGDQPWQSSLRQALTRWTKQSPGETSIPRGKVHDAERLIEAGFTGVVNREFTERHTWTHDSVLGHLHSTSRFSSSVLGDELGDFDNAVLSALGSDRSKRFPQVVPCGYTIGRNGSGREASAVPED
ncbi:MAG: methyltransferase domain-containing protein [Gammaproteobacteria bacterium]|nr:methyltransferase domain-containing protein [Gammaproteobacteria bacterium]